METNNKDVSILIVDDEPDIREILQFNLQNEGYEIDLAESSEQAAKILQPKHRLILLDVMMAGISGFKFADQLRKEGNNIPIIFLTAKDTENDMLTGFSIGGDDYISKPFSIKEVVARVRSILKRTGGQSKTAPDNKLTIKDLIIDFDTKTVTVNGKPVELTKTEFNILVLLVQNAGRIFSRSDILDKAWKDDGIVLERTVDVHIARLRKKIGDYGDYIINRTGYGYTFNSPAN
ncbi:DNA-binding response OmpR family regulator [Dysgonomonas sp. PFB1-18]|uniref:response regulator transcription factor n=1 Tax=unclassified Dysgonomonas TaxID=2630389 RepID=UPI0024760D28|nr:MULTISPECIES: response regulator transcription factor [unclassified Dysgonomonas]MDH6309353.1 DNA-binding response OmpR family regulator [Dysgonomonas sp. PF1-14]MDH6339782.1 DNA-binding response OmpR family regulator [Dysgonomonas sp. PF1-16]MDH6381430.1 DNA-binding response OmpR family regulator [Dysgonomonas sp. PFB1-18]MDH6398645.1 DNA-binding response OmpR family regulator [Dysgonomonas sp. PF1-23]